MQHGHFEHAILIFIIVSSLKLVVDTYIEDGTSANMISGYIDILFNIMFTLEAIMKIVAYGFFLDDNSYLTESWS